LRCWVTPTARARLEAHLELASRDNVAVSTFADVATGKSTDQLARLHAIWGLTVWAKRKDAGLSRARAHRPAG
jgi:hypothetical protein